MAWKHMKNARKRIRVTWQTNNGGRSSRCLLGCENTHGQNENWEMQCCTLSKLVASGDTFHMIFRRIRLYTVFTGTPETAVYGKKFCSTSCWKHGLRRDAVQNQATQSLNPKASKRWRQVKNAVWTEEKTKGRKRHVVVDAVGNLLAVIVHAANIPDTKSGVESALFACECYPSIKRFCADAGYRGTFVLGVDEILGLGWIFRRKSDLMNGRNSLGVGLSSVLLAGWTTPAVLSKTMYLLSTPLRPLWKFLIFSPCLIACEFWILVLLYRHYASTVSYLFRNTDEKQCMVGCEQTCERYWKSYVSTRRSGMCRSCTPVREYITKDEGFGIHGISERKKTESKIKR